MDYLGIYTQWSLVIRRIDFKSACNCDFQINLRLGLTTRRRLSIKIL